MFRDKLLEVERQIPQPIKNLRLIRRQMLKLNRVTKNLLKVRRLHLSLRKKS